MAPTYKDRPNSGWTIISCILRSNRKEKMERGEQAHTCNEITPCFLIKTLLPGPRPTSVGTLAIASPANKIYISPRYKTVVSNWPVCRGSIHAWARCISGIFLHAVHFAPLRGILSRGMCGITNMGFNRILVKLSHRYRMGKTNSNANCFRSETKAGGDKAQARK